MAERKRAAIRRRIGITILIIVGTMLVCIGLYIRSIMQPTPPSSEVKRVTIAPGTGSVQISQLLEQSGIIRNSQAFTYYLKYKEQGSKFQAGEYEMLPGMTYDEIIDLFNKGLVVKEAGIKVTVPEGYTVKQIAEKMYQQFGTDPSLFLQAVQQYTGFTSQVFAQIPKESQVKFRLEGYLFPETYEWNKEITPDEMIDHMMLELDKKLGTLPDNWRQTISVRGLNFHQIMTVASLIEREVAVEEERPIVAGVIYNRLNKGMPLQIDATIQYLFDKPKDRLFEKDLQLESPYNTYLHTGLPPGPIASPSLASIQAALYPADTRYLFYVTKKDGSKGHLFAETYEQHQHNIAASKKNQ